MSFDTVIDNLVSDTLRTSLPLFGAELALCATIVLMLLARVFNVGQKIDSFLLALVGSVAALFLAAQPVTSLINQASQAGGSTSIAEALTSIERTEIFTGLLVVDPLTIFFRCLLMAFVVLFVIFTKISGIPDREDAADFYSLVLGAALGMCLMVSANHLLMVFLAVEMASVPSYVLAGVIKGRPRASEAALKYSVYGAGTAGVMLYGISLLAGITGEVHLPALAVRLAEMGQQGLLADHAVVLALGALMVMVGLAFKLSAVPFHFWCPDVFEGATAEVNAFLSVASKAAALALLVRVALGVSYVEPAANLAAAEKASAREVVTSGASGPGDAAASDAVTNVHDVQPPAPIDRSHGAMVAALSPAREFSFKLIALLAMLTCTLGNLAAYAQTNIKRLLAYSTIAHAGYMMMPVAAAVYLAGSDPAAARDAIAALTFYVAVYLFMNLGAFAIVAFLRNGGVPEEIAAYAGLIKRCPGVVLCFAIILFSLIGLPPLAGFWPKMRVFGSLVDANHPWLWTLLAVGGLNTAISLYYYLRVAKVMTIDPEPEDRTPVNLPLVTFPGMYVAVVTAPVVVLGVFWDSLHEWARAATAALLG